MEDRMKRLAESKGFLVVNKNFELISSKLNNWYGYVYVIEIDKSEIKIGSSLNVSRRLANLITGIECYTKSKVTNILVSKPHNNYKENEYFLHKKFADYRKNTTECFTLSVKEFLKYEFEISFLSEHKEKELKSEAVGEMFKRMICEMPRKTRSLADVLWDNFTKKEIEILFGNFMAIFKNILDTAELNSFKNTNLATTTKCLTCGEYKTFKFKSKHSINYYGLLYCKKCDTETMLFDIPEGACCSICDELWPNVELNEQEVCPECVGKQKVIEIIKDELKK